MVIAHRFWKLWGAVLLLLAPSSLPADDGELWEQARKGLRQAVGFFRSRIATEGGYLWRYSDDLSRREGEGKATASMVWVQPPGTPTVGMAYLAAFEATKDPYFLGGARDVAICLVKGQLQSGGWDYAIEFDPAKRKRFAYRADGAELGKNVTTLDDDNTQAALRLLMRVDAALQFKDAKIHEAVVYALSCLLKAQYPNGAWPQRYDRFPEPAKFPVKKANFPATWSRTYPGADYKGFYTLNDDTQADMIDTLVEAARIYNEAKYKQAALRGGDFLLLAQLPEPQPAWAQQYDADMQPAWARKFEPPAVTGGESQGAMRVLLRLYRATGEQKYLEPFPKALDYFRRSRLRDGRLARFYELQTNKPLFFTKKYQLTYDDSDVPTHYGFKVGNNIEAIAKEYEQLRKQGPPKLKAVPSPKRSPASKALQQQVRTVLAALDKQGRWVDDGKLRYHGADDPTKRIIDCQTFVRNVGILTNYLKSGRP